MRFGHALELADQEVVQPLAGESSSTVTDFTLGACRGLFAPYNVFH
jgi:hypothetical protein